MKGTNRQEKPKKIKKGYSFLLAFAFSALFWVAIYNLSKGLVS